ncbi:MAG: hypothetical protein AVDCRST_MAG88-722 [uncultured Thermomicrobiales bacterium]|uniref:Uncharacterized protein n=1 Tax=uncultured Thermomicrobiales bacterium TaxID=1645740 RepID=A0A6J4UGT2_9BACT|nr:MAG: hypothetical protein AVDCRST_MAG88-722 [uncultured Thermomicrobiales bacterium]
MDGITATTGDFLPRGAMHRSRTSSGHVGGDGMKAALEHLPSHCKTCAKKRYMYIVWTNSPGEGVASLECGGGANLRDNP